MGIQKSFIIKNGIEVNSNLIFGDTTSDRVGIGTTTPQYTLHVNGGIGATDVTVSDELNILGKVSIGGSYGNNGAFLISTGAGVTWSSLPQLREVETYTATTGQTIFNFSYSPVGGVDVYVNGVRLSPSEYTATNGSTIILNEPCFGEETVDLIAYSISALGTGVTGITGLTIFDEGTSVGNDGNIVSINFVGAYVTTTSTGFGVTVFVSEPTPPLTYWSSTAAGIHTLSNVGVGTTNPRYNLEVASVGASGTSLWVNGNARVTGILTVGSSSIILDGANNTINVGSGVTINGSSGLIQASSINLNGETITGSGVTSIIAGSGIALNQSTGEVVITNTFNQYWESTTAGIHTLSNVGIGTTNPTSALTVQGNASISGIVTASGGFISVGNTTPIQISVVGNQLTFTAVGIGSTTLTLF